MTLQSNGMGGPNQVTGSLPLSLNIHNSIQTSSTSIQAALSLPSSVSLTMTNSQASASNAMRSTKLDDVPHNLVVHRSIPVSNGIDMDHLYRNQQPLHLRNGIHDSFRRDAEMSPVPLNNHESFRRVPEYDDEDNAANQREIHHMTEQRNNEIVEAHIMEQSKHIVKPAPMQARLLSVVEANAKDPIKRYYVIPHNTEKKLVLIKNEPADIVQVNNIFAEASPVGLQPQSRTNI